ncbi:hypothetical protein H6P81_006378 [Aristolochia fimbriata]|uniref:Uncharacterized protein n=1 Tax=Aristolochia fimbriata TaxID=158543 RepID=A0AAV7EYI4_ARIFI|nr:hypothetical protein H6P81_006378 [Aristolochia fimbriata]
MTTRLRRNSAVVALCFCLFLAAALLSSARNTVTISGKERRAAERSLAASGVFIYRQGKRRTRERKLSFGRKLISQKPKCKLSQGSGKANKHENPSCLKHD